MVPRGQMNTLGFLRYNLWFPALGVPEGISSDLQEVRNYRLIAVVTENIEQSGVWKTCPGDHGWWGSRALVVGNWASNTTTSFLAGKAKGEREWALEPHYPDKASLSGS